jgi:hypothetical protein
MSHVDPEYLSQMQHFVHHDKIEKISGKEGCEQ